MVAITSLVSNGHHHHIVCVSQRIEIHPSESDDFSNQMESNAAQQFFLPEKCMEKPFSTGTVSDMLVSSFESMIHCETETGQQEAYM